MDEENKKPSIADLFQINVSPAGKKNSLVVYDSKQAVDNLAEIENDDLKYSRDNIVQLIEQGTGAISELSAIASQSQQTRAYEVLGSLLKTMLDANLNLADLHEKNRKLKENKDSKPPTVNNNLILSTEELAKLIEAKKKKS